MKNVLIVENTPSSLQVKESVSSRKDYILGGTFTEFDVKNRNERIYTADKFLPCLEELKGRMNDFGAVYGEFDHPDVFDTSLARASHMIKSVDYVTESNSIQGQIKLLNTHWGREAKALVDDDCPLFVSSRAAGITESDGTVTLKKLFTYDIVADPGFSSAKVTPINESVGYSNDTNFRIYEMSDESKINELFNMNKNDMVTKNQLADYSKYLVNEIATAKKQIKTAVKQGNLDSKKLESMLEYYDNLMESQDKVAKYLDYLAEQVSIVVNENKQLRKNQEKIIEHNDYLAENLEKTINYSEYLAENLDKTIDYSEYLAENLDKNIDYSEYLAENLDKSIDYSEYLAENLDKNIDYSEYLAENLDKTIEYSEYIAENLDKNIEYSEYIAEHVDNNIAYSEYLAENLEGNIAYSEYIAEHLDDNIAYADYIAENLDKTIGYNKMIVEKLNSSEKLFENYEDEEEGRLPSPEEAGFEQIPEDEYEDGEEYGDEMASELDDENCRVVCDDDEEMEFGDEEEAGEMEETPELELEPAEGDALVGESKDEDEDMKEEKEEDEEDEDKEVYLESNFSSQIDQLINEAKKRKASETQEHHFLKFLNKAQVDSFYSLSQDEQERVTVHINESEGFFSTNDVLKLMKEALETKNESLDEKLLRLMPEQIKPIWEQMTEKEKVSVLSQSRLYPEMKSEDQIEHFWLTRNMKKNESVNKQLIDSSENSIIQEDKLSDEAMNGILERFKTL